jgi:hypothetical protein
VNGGSLGETAGMDDDQPPRRQQFLNIACRWPLVALPAE